MRLATPADAPVLERMLLHAVNWDDEREPLSREEALASPEIAHYVTGWPGRRDAGLIAIATATEAAVGAAWWTYFPLHDPGYGFVSADVPEVTVAVDGAWRGRGVGRLLLESLHDLAIARGVERLSLSVENANAARRLYLALGYELVTDDGNASTLVVSLRPGAGGPAT